jgi:hypothetical protein
MLRLFRLITTMDALAPLPSLAEQKPTWASAPTLARSWRLNQLIDRLGREGLTVVARNVANGRSGHSLTSQKRVVAIGSTVKRTAASGELPARSFPREATAKILGEHVFR